MSSLARTPTVAILGASYGGGRVAHLLAKDLPEGWRVVLIDRNSHFNHLYVFPRYAILPGHEHKAFIPYDNVFVPPRSFNASGASSQASGSSERPSQDRAVLLHATVTSISHYSLTLDKAFPEYGVTESDRTLHFDYLVYALGSHLPAPINVWGPVADEDVESADVLNVSRGTKEGGVAWLKRFQKRVQRASSVLVVGGGALGIQIAADIAELHPATQVALLHSRQRLLPRFDEAMHSEIISSLSSLDVCTILGDRLDLASLGDKQTRNGERVVRTQSGREISAELVLLCTGQTPNTTLLANVFPQCIVQDGAEKGMARVRRTLQLAEPNLSAELPNDFAQLSLFDAPSSALTPESTPEDEDSSEIQEDPSTRVAAEHIFAIGDAADAFGAINAGHNAFFQGEVVAHNIVKLIKRKQADSSPVLNSLEVEELTLEKYMPPPPAIKVTLGLTKCVYQSNGVIGTRDKEPADLDVHVLWQFYGFDYGREDIEVDRDEWATVPASVV